jgi:hypothetical protein
MMTDKMLDDIAQRAALFTDYGDRAALRPEDVVDLMAEVRRCRDNEAHLVLLVRQGLDRLGELEAEAHAAAQDAAEARREADLAQADAAMGQLAQGEHR